MAFAESFCNNLTFFLTILIKNISGTPLRKGFCWYSDIIVRQNLDVVVACVHHCVLRVTLFLFVCCDNRMGICGGLFISIQKFITIKRLISFGAIPKG